MRNRERQSKFQCWSQETFRDFFAFVLPECRMFSNLEGSGRTSED